MTTEKLYHQDGDEKREYTEAEYAQNAKDIADAAAIKAEQNAKAEEAAAIKGIALAKLEALGLTADDLKALGL